jgi:hypothetical protein
MIVSAHISNPLPFVGSPPFAVASAAPFAKTVPQGFSKALATANSASQLEKPKVRNSSSQASTSSFAQLVAPVSAQAPTRNDPAALQSLYTSATGAVPTETSGSPAAGTGQSGTLQQGFVLLPGAVSQSAISQVAAMPNASANGQQLQATPAELLASFLSSAILATNNIGATSSGKTVPNAPTPNASDSINQQLQSVGSIAPRNGGSALGPFTSSPSQQPAFSSGQLLRDVREKLAGLSTKAEAAPQLANANVPAARGAVSATTDSPAMETQRAISDARNALTGQFETRLQGALNVPTATGTSGAALTAINAREAVNADAGNQGNAQSNSQDSDQRKGSDGTSSDSAGTESATSSVVGIDTVAEALKVSGLIASTPTSPLHSGPEATSQCINVAAPASMDPGANSAISNSASSTKPNLPLPLPSPATQPSFSSDAVKASEIYQRAEGSEMHIAMQTDLLGSLDLRATIHQSALTATISVQRSDVQLLLASELPSLQHALADRNLHVEQISILNNSVNDRTASNGQQAQQQKSNLARPETFGGPGAVHSLTSEDGTRTNSSGAEQNLSQGFGRLSIHV